MDIKLFDLHFDQLLIRYYLLMGVVIASLFAGIPALALLSLPIFLSALLGARFTWRTKAVATQERQLIPRNRFKKAS